MFLKRSIFKNYNCLLVPVHAGLPAVMLTPYQHSMQKMQSTFKQPECTNTCIFLQHSRCYQVKMPFTQKLHHRCSVRPRAFWTLQCVPWLGICMANFSQSDKLQETCAIHFSMHLTYRWPVMGRCSTCLLPRDPPGKEKSVPVINLDKEWALSKRQQRSYQ